MLAGPMLRQRKSLKSASPAAGACAAGMAEAPATTAIAAAITTRVTMRSLLEGLLPLAAFVATPELRRIGITRRAGPQHPADHHPDQQNRRDEDEVRRGHVREIHERLRPSARDTTWVSSCSTRASLRHRPNT